MHWRWNNKKQIRKTHTNNLRTRIFSIIFFVDRIFFIFFSFHSTTISSQKRRKKIWNEKKNLMKIFIIIAIISYYIILFVRKFFMSKIVFLSHSIFLALQICVLWIGHVSAKKINSPRAYNIKIINQEQRNISHWSSKEFSPFILLVFFFCFVYNVWILFGLINNV